MDSLNPLQYGTVTGRFLVELGDSDDSGFNPDVYPAKGFLTFRPATTYANVKTAKPDPTTIFPQTVFAVLDSEGYLCSVMVDANGVPRRSITGEYIPVERGIRIQASSDPNIIPTNWTWNVAFNLSFNGNLLTYPAFDFTLEPGQKLDLAYAKPTAQTQGTITITGPKGETGETGPKGDTGPVNVLSIGKVSTLPTNSAASVSITGDAPSQVLNFDLPAGPVGPSGGPIPAGGAANQIIRKTATGGYEWVSPSGYTYAAEAIPDSTNLSSLTTANLYYQEDDSKAAIALNYPEKSKGLLYVDQLTTLGAAQTYVAFNSGKTFTRSYLNSRGTWTNWETPLLSRQSSVDATANTVAVRDLLGNLLATKMVATTAVTSSSSDSTLTRKDYVDSSIASGVGAINNMTTISTADLNTLTTPGTYFTSDKSVNAPALVGLTFGGHLNVVRTMAGGYNRGVQTLTITLVDGKSVSRDWYGSWGSDFWGLTFSRAFEGTTFQPWSMQGDTPLRDTGITLDPTNVVNTRLPVVKRITNGKLQLQGTLDMLSTLKNGQILTLDGSLTAVSAQVTANTEATSGWGKFSLVGTVGTIYTNAAGTNNWITFQGLWDLA